MQRSIIASLLFFTAAILSTPSLSGEYMSGGHNGMYNGPYSVELNKTQLLRLSSPASAVVIGNPAIADVSVHSRDTIMVVGRGYGETNLIVIDQSGQVLINTDIQVTASRAANSVRLFNGSSRSSYSCSPHCLPAPILGDNPTFISSNTAEAPSMNNTSAMPISTNTMTIPQQ